MTKRIITAMFHSEITARRAADRLRALGVPDARLGLHSATAEDGARATHHAPGSEHGLLQLLDAMFLPRADFDAHLEALRRGGTVLTAEVEEEQSAAIREALQDAGAEDLDAHEQDWMRQGWNPRAATSGARPPERPQARRLPHPGPARSYVIEAPLAEGASHPDDLAGGRPAAR